MDNIIKGLVAVTKGALMGYGAYCAATKTKTGKKVTSKVISSVNKAYDKLTKKKDTEDTDKSISVKDE